MRKKKILEYKENVVLCYIMPEAVKSWPEIYDMIQKAGFDFKRQDLYKIDKAKSKKVKKFLRESLKITPYEEIIILLLIKDNAIKEFQKIIGDLENPDPESIRGIFGFNSIYCSTSNESAKEESLMFFSRAHKLWE